MPGASALIILGGMVVGLIVLSILRGYILSKSLQNTGFGKGRGGVDWTARRMTGAEPFPPAAPDTEAMGLPDTASATSESSPYGSAACPKCNDIRPMFEGFCTVCGTNLMQMQMDDDNTPGPDGMVQTPLGIATFRFNEAGALTRFTLADPQPERLVTSSDPMRAELQRQVNDYFTGTSRSFNLPLAPEGTEFQKRVWSELQNIPYGTTITYGELAERIGDPNAVRAVGSANGANPIWIIIPCHRVIGADGSLTGYAGGIEVKRQLLEQEGALPPHLF